MSDEEMMPHDDDMPEAPDTASEHDVAGAALGALTQDERDALEAALAADARLDMELATMNATVAELARLAPEAHINRGRSAGIRSRLTSRAAATRGERPAASHTAHSPSETMSPVAIPTQRDSGRREPAKGHPANPPARMTTPPSNVVDLQQARQAAVARAESRAASHIGGWRFLAAAAVLACVGIGAELMLIVRERDRLRDAVAARDALTATQVASLQATMVAKDRLIASLTGPNMKVVDLVDYKSSDPAARMFWDQKTHEWTMYAYNLRQPKAGKTFQVWLIASTAPAPISAGTFRPDARGEAILHAKYPLDRGALQKIAISEEPDGGVSAPTGPIIIAGRGR